MGIISWIVLGLVAGYLASVFMKTNDKQSMTADLLIGILGAVIFLAIRRAIANRY